MGNQISIFEDVGNEKLDSIQIGQKINYDYIINHPVLKNTQFISEEKFLSAAHETLVPNKMKTKLQMQTYAQIDEWGGKINKFKQIKNEYILFPLQIITAAEATFGYYKQLQLVFQCYPYILMDQINMRKKMNNNFQEDQIWYTLWVLVESASTLLVNNLSIGDIRPHNILFNETGDIKIISQFSWPKEETNFAKMLKNRVITYLSPQQVQMVNKGMDIDTPTPLLAESFSIGLTILSLLYLQDGSKLYKIQQGKANNQNFQVQLDVETLEKIIKNMSTLTFYNTKLHQQMKYSDSLLKIVEGLCQKNMNSRHNIRSISQTLTPFRSKILNFQPFELATTSIYSNNLFLSPLHLTETLATPQQYKEIRLQKFVPQAIRLHPRLLVNPKEIKYTPAKRLQSHIPQFKPSFQLKNQHLQYRPYLMPNKLINPNSIKPVIYGEAPFSHNKRVNFISKHKYSINGGYEEKKSQPYLHSQPIHSGHSVPLKYHQEKNLSIDKYKTQQELKNNNHRKEFDNDKKKKIYRSSTVKKTNIDSPIQSLNSSRYQYQVEPRQQSKNTLNQETQVNNHEVENKKNPYSVITLQKVISSKNNINSKSNNQNLSTHTYSNRDLERFESRKQTKLKEDEQLLALVQRQLMKSKSLFPSPK